MTFWFNPRDRSEEERKRSQLIKTQRRISRMFFQYAINIILVGSILRRMNMGLVVFCLESWLAWLAFFVINSWQRKKFKSECLLLKDILNSDILTSPKLKEIKTWVFNLDYGINQCTLEVISFKSVLIYDISHNPTLLYFMYSLFSVLIFFYVCSFL